MDYKYLSDGRKVSVIGKLNIQETIVQEIFIKENGCEVPGGEDFVVKSLHDEPVISWKKRESEKIEKNLEEIKSEFEKYSKQKKEIYQELLGYKEILKSTKKLIELLPEHELETFSLFLTGTIEYLVVGNYYIEPPVRLIDQIIGFKDHYNERHFDQIKLLSVLGSSGGNINYNINRWCDGSGSNTNIYPFTNKQDAIDHIKKQAEVKIDKNRLSSKEYAVCEDLEIVFSDEYINRYETNADIEKNKEIEKLEATILKNQTKIKNLKDLRLIK